MQSDAINRQHPAEPGSGHKVYQGKEKRMGTSLHNYKQSQWKMQGNLMVGLPETGCCKAPVTAFQLNCVNVFNGMM